MIGELEIFNMALLNLSIEPIGSLGGNDKRAIAHRTYYPNAIDNCLKSITPKFARKIESLNLISGHTIPGFDYVYQYPGDCIKFLGLRDPNDSRSAKWDIRRIGEISQTVIVTNIEDAVIDYISKVHETSLFPTDFRTALEYHLSMDCAVYLVGGVEGMNLRKFFANEYRLSCIYARNSDFTQSKNVKSQSSPFIEVR